MALGAFGAHALKARLPAELVAVFQTAVQYHAWHALALLAVALATPHFPKSNWLYAAGWLFVGGILLFSGSLYALSLGAPRGIGLMTPVGGVCFLCGWLALAAAALRG